MQIVRVCHASHSLASRGSQHIFHVQRVVATNSQLLSVSFTDMSGKRSQEYPAVVLNTDPDHDLAVLRVEAPASELHPIRCAADMCAGTVTSRIWEKNVLAHACVILKHTEFSCAPAAWAPLAACASGNQSLPSARRSGMASHSAAASSGEPQELLIPAGAATCLQAG